MTDAKSLRLVRSETPEQKAIAKQIILGHHSYVKSTIIGGRRIDYLIMLDDKPVGCIGVSSIPFPISKCVLDYFQRVTGSRILKPIMNTIGNNWKFTLIPEGSSIPNAGSRVLSIFVKLAAQDWKGRYGDELKWILTFVGAGKQGHIYKGAGWQYLGKTAGISIKVIPNTPGAKVHLSIKERMSKTTSEPGEKKLIFLKDLRKKGEGEAVVVQGSTSGFQSGNGGHTDPAAPLTKSYKMVVKGGKVRMVRDTLLSLRVDPKSKELVILKGRRIEK